MKQGMVYLVGAGPGDPGLITKRGMELLQQCEAVVYDRLASVELLDYVSEACECVYVGKQAGSHSVNQDRINERLITLAREGKRVVRLKGGDPYVFGRGGEEVLALKVAGIPYEVVPGVTSCISVPELVGIPITHRGASRSFHVVTGHTAEEGTESNVDYEVLARLEGTLVFLMGLSKIETIMQELKAHGKDRNTCVAVISKGGTRQQRMVKGTVGTIADLVHKEKIKSPAVIVVGEVAGLSLMCEAKGALSGVRIGVTGTKQFVEKLSVRLRKEGAICYPMPYVKVEEVESEEYTYAVHHLKDYGVVVFTSTNAVHLFMRKLRKEQIDLRALATVKLAAIGNGTAESLKGYGLYVDWIPEEFTTKSLAELLCLLVARKRILIPRAKNASNELADRLRAEKKNFEEIPIYELKHDQEKKESYLREIEELDYLSFGSSEGVRGFFEGLEEAERTKLTGTRFVCIGEVTRATLSGYVDKEMISAKTYTAEGVAEAIMKDVEDGKTMKQRRG